MASADGGPPSAAVMSEVENSTVHSAGGDMQVASSTAPASGVGTVTESDGMNEQRPPSAAVGGNGGHAPNGAVGGNGGHAPNGAVGGNGEKSLEDAAATDGVKKPLPVTAPTREVTVAKALGLSVTEESADARAVDAASKYACAPTSNEDKGGSVPMKDADVADVPLPSPDAELSSSNPKPEAPTSARHKSDPSSLGDSPIEPPSKKIRVGEIDVKSGGEAPKESAGNASSTVAGSPPESPLITAPPRPHGNLEETEQAKKGPLSSPSAEGDPADKERCDPLFASLVDLSPVPEVPPLEPLKRGELEELQRFLQIGHKINPDNEWKTDWSGNLQLLEKELVMNARLIEANPAVKPIKKSFHDFVAETSSSPEGFRGVRLLFRHVYHMEGTPPMAQKLLSFSLTRWAKTADERSDFILDAFRRISYDPVVLRQDGWTTAKAATPEGATGGAFLIGKKVIWERYEAVVIAYVFDDDLGDLWKAMWLSDQETFDLEADELQEAIKRWEARKAKARKTKPTASAAQSGSTTNASRRFSSYADFTVEGAEHGIILAKSIHPKARNGVFWPARIMHVSETGTSSTRSVKRSSSQKNVSLIFLAPYWNGKEQGRRRETKDKAPTTVTAPPTNIYSAGHLFEMEAVEAAEQLIKKYPYEDRESLSIDQLRAEFRFLGLPKAAFPRFLDSHRLAAALKSYARENLTKPSSTSTEAFSALTECHAMSIKTPVFPPALLQLPYDYMLLQLPHPSDQAQVIGDDQEEMREPIVKLESIMNAMCPPKCFGKISEQPECDIRSRNNLDGPPGSLIATPQCATPSTPSKSSGGDHPLQLSFRSVASDYLCKALGENVDADAEPAQTECPTPLVLLRFHMSSLLSQVCESVTDNGLQKRREKRRDFVNRFVTTKLYGEDVLQSAVPQGYSSKTLLSEWRKACERTYKKAIALHSIPGCGNGVTAIITDTRCNQHLTASGSFERAVRIPAAMRGAKRAGAGSDESIPILLQVNDYYMDIADRKVVPKAHKNAYLKRIKSKVAGLAQEDRGAPLTEGSDGEGGEDTRGSRGSYTAALTGVAAALQGVDMVLDGDCVNAFCAIRPPGHHAGRDLHPMNAVSNGFCLLNAAACAALYAVTPQSEGGRGLRRVCVIDFDVHHGNGTQDILCSTYDPRFLYVSLHAGGSHINGFEESDGEDSETDYQGYRRSLGGSKQDGIFPGKCGDTCPHPGVLNIPLGQKVTPHAIGTALVTQVSPGVEKFAPDLIILSAGFDAHKFDPLGMGGLSSEDFGSVTEVACQVAAKCCSGRVISLLEGGYGVPCCRPLKDQFLPENLRPTEVVPRVFDLDNDIPNNMEDEMPYGMRQKLDKCYSEGFVACVTEHVKALSKCGKSRK